MKMPIATLIVLSLLGCKSSTTQNMDQGINGKVLWLEGNFMPGPGQSKEGAPIERSIYIYPLLNASSLDRSGHFYKMPNISPIKVVTSNTEGAFTASLAPGKYTLLTKEEGGLYGNLQDGQGNVNPVEVNDGVFTEITIKIDYKAAY